MEEIIFSSEIPMVPEIAPKQTTAFDDDDSLEYPPDRESEEDRAFRLHISDEQRKFDTSQRVAKSAGIETWPDEDPLPF